MRCKTIAAALIAISASLQVVAQDHAEGQWRFRFPSANANEKAASGSAQNARQRQKGSSDSTGQPQARVASRQDAKPDLSAANVRLPLLADSQIVLEDDDAQDPDKSTTGSTRLAQVPSIDTLGDPRSTAPSVASDPYAIAQASYGQGWFDRPWIYWPSFQQVGRIWVRPEYLYWNNRGMRTPALVTGSPFPTPRPDAGVLGRPGTSVLFGGGEINGGWEDGYRIAASTAVDPDGLFRFEGEYLRIFDLNDSFAAESNDRLDPTNIFGRPFTDATSGLERAQLISYDDVASGSISIGVRSRMQSFGLYGRMATSSAADPCEIALGNSMIFQFGQFNFLFGYRYARLQDGIAFNELLNSLDLANPGSFEISESFATDNKFNGLEVGWAYYSTWRRFSTEWVTKLAVGSNQQTVAISGFSDITEAAFKERFVGGVLAQRSNIGTYQREQLAVVPQVSWILGTQVTSFLSLRIGYNLFYFSNVVRAGDQIDTTLNPNLFPPEAVPPVTEPLRPRFAFRETDYWSHGISFGTDFRF